MAAAENATATALGGIRATDDAATATSAAAAWATSTAEALPGLAAGACPGQAVASTAAYAEGAAPHSILIATQDGDVHAWNDYIPDAWRPEALSNVQLVACLAPEVARSIQECAYNGPSITRYIYQQFVQVVAASTGEIIAETVIEGVPPRDCRQSEPYNLTTLYGEQVGANDVVDWLAEIVEHNVDSTSGEPVEWVVSMLEGERVVAAYDDIVLSLRWTTAIESYVWDFQYSASTRLEIDGAEAINVDDYWAPPEQAEEDLDGDGVKDFTTYWLYPLQSLEPGRHVITLTISLAFPITDGYDFDGDGSEDYYSEPMISELILIVQ